MMLWISFSVWATTTAARGPAPPCSMIPWANGFTGRISTKIWPHTGNRHAVLGGYHFLAVEANYQTEDYDAATLDWVEQTLQSVVSAPDYDGRQIFVLTHFAPNDTVFGCIGSTGLSNILRDYPQAVLLTGHSHYSIYDERAIMQTDFTTLNLGSVSYMGLPAGYVESTHSGLIEESYTLSVGTLVEIDRYGNLRITRIDFTQDEIIKQPWIIPAPAEDRSHLLYYPQERGTLLNEAPAFAGNCKIQAFPVRGQRAAYPEFRSCG